MKTLILALALVSLALVACNAGSDGSSTTSFPITQSGNNQRALTIQDSSGTTHNIRLMPLSDERVAEALDIQKKLDSTQVNASPLTSYSVASKLLNKTESFYGSNQLPVLNQQDFGTCVTFSSSAALSYQLTGTTISVSPLYMLYQSYQSGGFLGSGWAGLSGGDVLLNRFLATNNWGYYPNYTSTINTYNTISNQYAASGDRGNLTNSQLTALTGFKSGLQSYPWYITNTSKTKTTKFSNIAWKTLDLKAGNSTNASKVKTALDKGYNVLLDFNIYSSTCKKADPTGTINYRYNNATGVLTFNPNSLAYMHNTWTNPSGCLLAGHQIFVFSYAQTTSGNLIFFLRNSWGNTGNQGQYYMTDNYMNNAASKGYAICKATSCS